MSEQMPLALGQIPVPGLIDAITYQLVLVGDDGTILAANTAWRNFRCREQSLDKCIGQHYHEAFNLNQGVSTDDIQRLRRGIQVVLSGSLAHFHLVYACERRPRSYWLELIATPILGLPEGRNAALLTQNDISKQRAFALSQKVSSDSDPLTGLANQDHFLFEGAHLLALAKHQEWSSALMYLDLDDFKAINDHRGQEVGNEVLKRVAASLQQHTRKGDLLARLEGDEFVMLLNNVSKKHVAGLVQAYRQALPQAPIPVQGSFGVAYYPEDGQTLEDLLAYAEKVMYHAKASSRARKAAESHRPGSPAEKRREHEP